MPKLIDYPRTSYNGAWELAEVVDDTGGKCAIDTAARKLNRKVSGSFKAIIGSAVKFGLMTSKRELLTTTTLFKRIKHAYDKEEELQFHREAFLTPPLFTQLCRKFRNRELPVQMLDVMLIREFGVEEINAQSVAKAFVDGCRMCSLLDERNIIADIDAFPLNRSPRRELSSPTPMLTTFAAVENTTAVKTEDREEETDLATSTAKDDVFQIELLRTQERVPDAPRNQTNEVGRREALRGTDAVASLFGFNTQTESNNAPDYRETNSTPPSIATTVEESKDILVSKPSAPQMPPMTTNHFAAASTLAFQIQVSGPGINTALEITDEADIALAIALLEKIRRQLRS